MQFGTLQHATLACSAGIEASWLDLCIGLSHACCCRTLVLTSWQSWQRQTQHTRMATALQGISAVLHIQTVRLLLPASCPLQVQWKCSKLLQLVHCKSKRFGTLSWGFSHCQVYKNAADLQLVSSGQVALFQSHSAVSAWRSLCHIDLPFLLCHAADICVQPWKKATRMVLTQLGFLQVNSQLHCQLINRWWLQPVAGYCWVPALQRKPIWHHLCSRTCFRQVRCCSL